MKTIITILFLASVALAGFCCGQIFSCIAADDSPGALAFFLLTIASAGLGAVSGSTRRSIIADEEFMAKLEAERQQLRNSRN